MLVASLRGESMRHITCLGQVGIKVSIFKCPNQSSLLSCHSKCKTTTASCQLVCLTMTTPIENRSSAKVVVTACWRFWCWSWSHWQVPGTNKTMARKLATNKPRLLQAWFHSPCKDVMSSTRFPGHVLPSSPSHWNMLKRDALHTLIIMHKSLPPFSPSLFQRKCHFWNSLKLPSIILLLQWEVLSSSLVLGTWWNEWVLQLPSSFFYKFLQLSRCPRFNQWLLPWLRYFNMYIVIPSHSQQHLP